MAAMQPVKMPPTAQMGHMQPASLQEEQVHGEGSKVTEGILLHLKIVAIFRPAILFQGFCSMHKE